MRQSGMTLRQIARFLSEIGVPTKNRGKKWHPEMVNRIIMLQTKSSQNDNYAHRVIEEKDERKNIQICK